MQNHVYDYDYYVLFKYLVHKSFTISYGILSSNLLLRKSASLSIREILYIYRYIAAYMSHEDRKRYIIHSSRGNKCHEL